MLRQIILWLRLRSGKGFERKWLCLNLSTEPELALRNWRRPRQPIFKLDDSWIQVQSVAATPTSSLIQDVPFTTQPRNSHVYDKKWNRHQFCLTFPCHWNQGHPHYSAAANAICTKAVQVWTRWTVAHCRTVVSTETVLLAKHLALVSHFTFESAHHTPVFSNELRLV
jgi:hypothetical protein